MNDSSPNDRSALRKSLRAKRRALSPELRASYSFSACQHLYNHPAFLRARRIGVYWPTTEEIDPRFLFAMGPLSLRKQWALPVVSAKSMSFFAYRVGDPMISHHWGIKEPIPVKSQQVPLWQLDLLVMPLVGFDLHGNRLGMGGGFYDRYLEPRPTQIKRPLLLGLAFGFQEVQPALEAEAWDQRLDGVITETGCTQCNRQGLGATLGDRNSG